MRPADNLLLLLLLLLLLSGVSCSEVSLDPQSWAILGHAVSLPCCFLGTGQVTQITWDKMTELGPQMVAIRSQDHGVLTHPFYGTRARFQVTTSDPDASLVIQDVTLADGGRFRCTVTTFPSGNFEKETWLTVLVPPQISIIPGERALLEGDRGALAATCVTTGSSPRATIRWESEVAGKQEEAFIENTNGTTTISSRFYLDPVRSMEGQKLSCLVNHSTFAKPARLDHQLSVYYVPEVSIRKSSNDWYVGMENAELTCEENGNPPAIGIVWSRLDGSLPNSSVSEGKRLLFRGSLSIEDAGTYVCEATNVIGSRTGHADIKIADNTAGGVNMLSMAFVAIGAVGFLLLITLVAAVVFVNRYHKKKTQEMVVKLEEISTMSRQPSIRRCNSMSPSVDARLQDGGGSRENDLEQEPILQEEPLRDMQPQLSNSSREPWPANGELTVPPPTFGSHRYSLRSVTENHAEPAYQIGSFHYSLRYSGQERVASPGHRTLPPPLPLTDHRDSTRDVAGTPQQRS
ncbi:nectin-4-like isoform X2 [Carcharodon carcharias]|uniref:nectin-4-like isoform X2 n=1 Tax=Carcharodon carcharias TaxID=13397 RepID=UPI001B7ED603|nr:nectin-4-like isoform X2 [Carcharodon carcharias]